MFAKLTNRYSLSGKLVLSSGLHVGTGIPDGDIDMPIMRDSANQPFIPGSSLRGVMRSLVERALATVAPGAGCILFDGSHASCPTSNQAGRRRVEKVTEEKGATAALEILLATDAKAGRLCDTCRLFGSTF